MARSSWGPCPWCYVCVTLPLGSAAMSRSTRLPPSSSPPPCGRVNIDGSHAQPPAIDGSGR
eukprot:8095233-Pyramimonas_sp.AAC.1